MDASESGLGRGDSDANPIRSPLDQPRRPHRVPNEERRRAVRACDRCRRVKEKCEGGIPCRRCAHLRYSCEFKEPPLRARDGAINRASNAPAEEILERQKYMERILTHKGIATDTTNLRRIYDAIVESEAEREQSGNATTATTTTTTTDDTPEEEDNLDIEEENFEIRPVEENITHYSGEFSYWNFSMRIKKHVEEHMAASNPQDAQQLSRVKEFWRPGQLNSASISMAEALSCYPPRHIANFLVNVFFKYAETNYFYVERSWLFEKLEILYTAPGQFAPKDIGIICTMLTIFAIGTQYAYLDSTNETERTSPGSAEDDIGVMFYQHAKRLLPDVIEISSLESVQACLLLGAYSLAVDVSGLAYTYLNLAIKLAMQNGMHRRCVGNNLNPVTIETRNRVWWTAYAIEKKISILHGRPLSVIRSDIDADLPKDRADMRSNRPSLVPHMLASLRMMDVLEDFLNEIILLQRCQKHEISKVLTRLIAIKNSFARWWEDFSMNVIQRVRSPHPAHSRSCAHLRLEYCLIRMFVGRPFLFNKEQYGPSPTSQMDTNSITSASPADLESGYNNRRTSKRTILVDDCVKAANEAIEICRSLRESGADLARASYVEYSSCRASLLVLIAFCIQNKTDQFHSTLQSGLAMIRIMSAAGESAKAEVSLIEAFERALTRLHSFGEGNNNVDFQRENEPPVSSYDHFKQWQSTWKSGGPKAPESSDPPNSVPNTTSTVVSTRPEPQPSPATTVMQNTYNPHHWAMNDLGFDVNTSGLGPLPSVAESTFFGLEDAPLSINGLVIPERQVLEDFLALPEHAFGFGAPPGNNN